MRLFSALLLAGLLTGCQEHMRMRLEATTQIGCGSAAETQHLREQVEALQEQVQVLRELLCIWECLP